MGDANNYLIDKKVMYNKEPYTLEKYAYDTNVQGSAEELIHIVGSLLEPVGAAMEDVMKTIEAIAEKGKEIVFSTGKIIFDSTTHFFTVADSHRATTNPLKSLSAHTLQMNQHLRRWLHLVQWASLQVM